MFAGELTRKMEKTKFKIIQKPQKSNPDYSKIIAKIWLIVASISIGINVFFVLTLLQMSPRLQVIANVMTPNSMNSLQLIQAEPFNADISDRNLIEQMLVRYYLIERFTIFKDEREMNFKWSPGGALSQLSTPRVHQEYLKSLGELPKKLKELNYTQNIDIRTMSLHNDKWTVEFDIYRLGTSFESKLTRVAVLQVRDIPARRFFRSNISNPYGFTIINYTDAEKK